MHPGPKYACRSKFDLGNFTWNMNYLKCKASCSLLLYTNYCICLILLFVLFCFCLCESCGSAAKCVLLKEGGCFRGPRWKTLSLHPITHLHTPSRITQPLKALRGPGVNIWMAGTKLEFIVMVSGRKMQNGHCHSPVTLTMKGAPPALFPLCPYWIMALVLFVCSGNSNWKHVTEKAVRRERICLTEYDSIREAKIKERSSDTYYRERLGCMSMGFSHKPYGL